MHRAAIEKIIAGVGPVARQFIVITTTDTRHHGLLDTELMVHGALTVRPNGNDHQVAHIATDHIVALLPQ